MPVRDHKRSAAGRFIKSPPGAVAQILERLRQSRSLRGRLPRSGQIVMRVKHYRGRARANWEALRDAADIHEARRRLAMPESRRRTPWSETKKSLGL